MPWEERPTYVKGQHLRGVDSDLAERCRAEIVRSPSLILEQRNLHDIALLACLNPKP